MKFKPLLFTALSMMLLTGCGANHGTPLNKEETKARLEQINNSQDASVESTKKYTHKNYLKEENLVANTSKELQVINSVDIDNKYYHQEFYAKQVKADKTSTIVQQNWLYVQDNYFYLAMQYNNGEVDVKTYTKWAVDTTKFEDVVNANLDEATSDDDLKGNDLLDVIDKLIFSSEIKNTTVNVEVSSRGEGHIYAKLSSKYEFTVSNIVTNNNDNYEVEFNDNLLSYAKCSNEEKTTTDGEITKHTRTYIDYELSKSCSLTYPNLADFLDKTK